MYCIHVHNYTILRYYGITHVFSKIRHSPGFHGVGLVGPLVTIDQELAPLPDDLGALDGNSIAKWPTKPQRSGPVEDVEHFSRRRTFWFALVLFFLCVVWIVLLVFLGLFWLG